MMDLAVIHAPTLPTMFFQSWDTLERTLIMGMLAYLTVVILLRITGKRTLSKWNSFDFIVTIALGSTLASIIVSKETTIAQGAVALGALIFLQYIVTWLAVRFGWLRRLIKSEPALLFYEGAFQHDTLRSERVTESEVMAALREHGIADSEEVAAVVLETDGTFSVITEIGDHTPSTLVGIRGFDEVWHRHGAA